MVVKYNSGWEINRSENAMWELKTQLDHEKKRFHKCLLEQSAKKLYLQSIPQPMQGVNPAIPTPSHSSEHTEEEKPSSNVDLALRSSHHQLSEPAQLHEKPKVPL